MPQLAPVNWLFLFSLFWLIIALSSTLIWWSFKTEYKLSSLSASPHKRAPQKTWSW
uniref:ATP synthase F0 subunit 8 n=1 Tax=Trochus sacellum TaxID=2985241 RepID=UPI0022380832|nr:ATP synthase F0 subunit 8 [Trochus sacellum]UYC29880.1 ATP synthase F0 subunit 8 [Trochus sacellum]